jgi:error-prone DNA polymerase
VRLGIASVRGAGDAAAPYFEAARQRASFRSVGDFARRSRLPRQVIERLAGAGGFAGFGLSRREALWQVAALPGAEAPLWRAAGVDSAPDDDGVRVVLPAMDAREELAADFIGLGLSIERNPVALVREALDRLGVRRALELNARSASGERAMVAGMVICRQRPATAKGMVFMTLEDETGLANLVLTPDVFERIRARARDLPLVVARGKVERQGLVVNLRVEDMASLEDVARAAPAPPVPVAASADLAEPAARVQPPQLPHVQPRNFR